MYALYLFRPLDLVDAYSLRNYSEFLADLARFQRKTSAPSHRICISPASHGAHSARRVRSVKSFSAGVSQRLCEQIKNIKNRPRFSDKRFYFGGRAILSIGASRGRSGWDGPRPLPAGRPAAGRRRRNGQREEGEEESAEIRTIR